MSEVGTQVGRVARFGSKLAAVTAALACLSIVSPIANVIGHFGVSYGTASAIIAAVASGGYVIDFLFPWIIPFVGTIQMILIAAGTGAAIGW